MTSEATKVALVHFNAGRFQKAKESLADELQRSPHDHVIMHMLGVTLFRLGQTDEAIQLVSRAIEAAPDYVTAMNSLANMLQVRGQIDDALALYQRAISLKPDLPASHYNLGMALQARGHIDEARSRFQRAIDLNENFAEAYVNLSAVLQQQNKLDEALTACTKAITINPSLIEAHINQGNILNLLERYTDAASAFQKALALNPRAASIHNSLGSVLGKQRELKRAIECFRKAIEIDPLLAVAHANLGRALLSDNRTVEAVACLQQAFAINPKDLEAYRNTGNALQNLGRLDEAAATYERALRVDRDYGPAFTQYIYCQSRMCFWENLPADEFLSLAQKEGFKGDAFPILILTDDPALQLKATQSAIEHLSQSNLPQVPAVSSENSKIRVAYLSADFREHAVAFLLAQTLELHDKSRFEIFGISYGPADDGPMRKRLQKAFDHFIDVREISDDAAARIISDHGIDIAIDLSGFTQHHRTEILAKRAAACQVNYLGYPGTMGADFIDYIIVDPFIVPEDQQQFYAEKLVYLPDCYQPSDNKRKCASGLTRANCGLPENAFVFCSFNNSFKIRPDIFDIWMRLLRAVPDSVLWLIDDNSWAQQNLRSQALARGVSIDRLIFAPRVPSDVHAARNRFADLCLDTFPYGGHTTTNDALWAGVPVVTYAGRSFASRVAGSLLQTLGFPELIATSLAMYEARAMELALDREKLAHLRAKINDARAQSPLFDTARLVHHLEAAYQTMVDNHRNGRPLKGFRVPAIT